MEAIHFQTQFRTVHATRTTLVRSSKSGSSSGNLVYPVGIWRSTTYLYYLELSMADPNRFPNTCVKGTVCSECALDHVSTSRVLVSPVFSKVLEVRNLFDGHEISFPLSIGKLRHQSS